MGADAILLARHGATEASGRGLVVGRRDIPLTATGREQALRLGELVRDRGLAAVYASDLRRAVETAELATRGLGLALRVDPRLAETDKGDWEGRLLEEVKRTERAAYDVLRHATASFRYPGGESLAEHVARVTAALGDVARGPLPALVVCHAGTVRCALALAHPDGLAAWRGFKVPNATPVAFDPACLPQAAQR